MGVKLNSTGGGSVTLDAPSTASNLTVTLPSASGTLVSTGSPFAGGTANGVVYLNGSSVPTAGSALTFDGTKLTVDSGTGGLPLALNASVTYNANLAFQEGGTNKWYLRNIANNGGFSFYDVLNSTEQMRLTSTGLGIGTSSPSAKLHVYSSGGGYPQAIFERAGTAAQTGKATIGMSNLGTSGTTNADMYVLSDYGIGFATNGASSATTVATITAAGNVGIGTSSPVARQQIKGSGTSGQVTASWILENSSSGTAGMDITGSAGSSYLRLLYGGGPSTGTNTLTETMRVGLEGVSAGVQQIKFAATQVPSSDANTLDDYEEGTWTPTMTGSSGAMTVTYTTRNGTYTKVGNIVTAYCYIARSSQSGGSGSLQVTGLPYATQTTTSMNYFGSSAPEGINTTCVPFIGSGGSTTVLFGNPPNNGSGWGGVQVSNVTGNGWLPFSITYQTA